MEFYQIGGSETLNEFTGVNEALDELTIQCLCNAG